MEPEFLSMAEQRRHEWLLEQRDKLIKEQVAAILREDFEDEPRIIEALPPRGNWAITINMWNVTSKERKAFCEFLIPILQGYDRVHPGHGLDMSSQPRSNKEG